MAAAYRREHAGHLNLPQLKVMSAIENCRTAALGGHVAACTKCDHQHIAYNSCRNRHCPKCQGAAAQDWMQARMEDLLPVEYFHVVFTLTVANRRHCLSEQGRGLRPVVQGVIRDASDHRSRSQTSWRKDRHDIGAAHMGLGDDAPSPCPRRCPGRRLVS